MLANPHSAAAPRIGDRPHGDARRGSGRSESERYRAADVTSGFRESLLLHAVGAPYTLVTEGADGARRTTELAGITQDSRRALAIRGRTRQAVPANFTYERIAPGIGYMNFRSMTGDLAPFERDLARRGATVSGSDRGAWSAPD